MHLLPSLEYRGVVQRSHWRRNLRYDPLPAQRTAVKGNRPQTKLDRDIYGGMGVTVGRLREDAWFDYKFVCLSHNTLRGAAGGAVLNAELLYKLGYFD